MPRPRTIVRHRNHRKAAPSTVDEFFPLLELPAELRNRVYEYVLVAPRDMKMVWFAGVNRRRKPIMFEVSDDENSEYPFNPMPYVCRQLRDEIAGLEIRFNSVLFDSSPRPKGGALYGLAMFTCLCTPPKLLWLTHIIVDKLSDSPTGERASTGPEWMAGHIEALRGLFVFSAQNKHVRIDLRMHGFTMTTRSRDFIATGIILTRVFRGTDLSRVDHGVDDIAKYDNIISHLFGAGRMGFEKLARAATNLRVYPDGRRLRHIKFRVRMLLGWEDTSVGVAYIQGGGAEAWTVQAREWIECGI